MRKSDMVNRLKGLISSLRSSNVKVTDKVFAESVLEECERAGMLPPGNPVYENNYELNEHVWSTEPENH